MKTIAVNSMHTVKHKNRGYAETWTSEQLDKLLSEPWLKQMVAEIRAGDVKKKEELPYICPHYTQFRNNHRAQADIIPEAFTYMTCVDVDDLSLVDKAIRKARRLNRDKYSEWYRQVLRIEYSARKKVHIYIRIPVGKTIEEAQRAFCDDMGVPYDESCITPERFIYLTGKAEEVYRSKQWLKPLSEEELNERREAYLNRGLDVDGRKLKGQTPSNSPSMGRTLKISKVSKVQEVQEEVSLWHGYDVQQIIDARYAEKLPCAADSNRHKESLKLASDLLIMLDGDKKAVQRIVEAQKWVQEIIEERNENVERTVNSAAERMAEKEKKYEWQQPSAEMRTAIAEVTGKTFREIVKTSPNPSQGGESNEQKTSIYAQLPLNDWAEELQELAKSFPCMKELFMNVHPMKLPAVLFSSAAMLGTLMTRTWYHFWYEPSIVRRLNYSIFIIGDPGAGKNLIEKLNKMLMAPIKESDDELIAQVNRYKDSRTERSTSTKAQKGDALKRPVVPIRLHPARTATGEFIRHMTAAVETVQGTAMNLHLFSFDSELDNVTKNNRGGDWKDREVLELKAFHNEQDGQMYANIESVTGMFNVYWNFIYTGTPYALGRKVTQRNFGNGMATRLAVIPMPDVGMAQRHQKVDTKALDRLEEWAYRLDKVEGELPIEPLNDETYDWQSSHMEIADFNNDKAERMLVKRIPYYGIGVAMPFILMRHWNEWQEKKTLTMDDKDRRLCRLAMEIQYRCQHFFFGEMAHIYFEDQNKVFVPRKRTTRYQECYRKLPDQFTTKQFMEVFGCSQPTASKAISRFLNEAVVEQSSYGHYKKRLKAL